MVRLSQIYTKTGDDGSTGLGDGRRVPKTDPRVEAYGTVDEANAAIGLCVLAVNSHHAADVRAAGIRDLLLSVQNELFDVGADLCCPVSPDEKPESRLRITDAQVERLERAIDEHNERLSALDSFVLPGGSALASYLHLARTIVRRAERCNVALLAAEPGTTRPETVRYLNRLSDLLFVLGRVANDDGRNDVKWRPGSGRS